MLRRLQLLSDQGAEGLALREGKPYSTNIDSHQYSICPKSIINIPSTTKLYNKLTHCRYGMFVLFINNSATIFLCATVYNCQTFCIMDRAIEQQTPIPHIQSSN